MADPARYRGPDGVYRFPLDRPHHWPLLTGILVMMALLGLLPLLVTDGDDRAAAAAIGLPFTGLMVGALWVLWKRRLDVGGRRMVPFDGVRSVTRDAIDLDAVVMAVVRGRTRIRSRVGHARRLVDPARILLVTSDGSGHRGIAAWSARRMIRRVDRDTFDRLARTHPHLGLLVVLIDDFGSDARRAVLRFLTANLPEPVRDAVRPWS